MERNFARNLKGPSAMGRPANEVRSFSEEVLHGFPQTHAMVADPQARWRKYASAG